MIKMTLFSIMLENVHNNTHDYDFIIIININPSQRHTTGRSGKDEEVCHDMSPRLLAELTDQGKAIDD